MATSNLGPGKHMYHARVSRDVSPTCILYVTGDGLTVTASGALVLSVDTEPNTRAVVVIASGHWFRVAELDPKTHREGFIESV